MSTSPVVPASARRAAAAAGVGSFIHVGCDVLATLQAAHEVLGIPQAAPSTADLDE